ncbi:MAG TPA: phosphatidate cytidylyltransferase [Flavobacteriales bacterium]|nr:phosphatidate cytidylyltransferase [Flavobacteriales bacterium]
MALSNLQTRVITGAVFGIVLIGGILLSEYALTSIALFILLVGCFEFNRLVHALSINTNRAFLYLANILVFAACIYFSMTQHSIGLVEHDTFLFLSIFIGLLFILFAWELFRGIPKPLENLASSILSLIYLGVPCGLLVSCSIGNDGNYLPWNVLYLFFFMWASDTGAYFTGRAFGKHKLFERLSPKKTIEGFIGGIVTAMLVGIAAYYFLGGASLPMWMLIGGVLSVTGSMGDLFESMLKRQANIKDSGTILPGHGGILDRFDSTLLSAPIYWVLLHFIQS